MSALVAVVNQRSIDALADAAFTTTLTGMVTKIRPKLDHTSVPGCLIGAIGVGQSYLEFARLARQRGLADFDALAAVCNELWTEAKSIIPPDLLGDHPCGVLVAGWSAKQRTFGLLVIDSEVCPQAKPWNFFIIGGSDACAPCLDRYTVRLQNTRKAFHPLRDGLAFIKEARTYPKDYGMFGAHPNVGGYVQHVRITQSSITSRIIYAWSDRVGRVISLDDEPSCAPAVSPMPLELAHA